MRLTAEQAEAFARKHPNPVFFEPPTASGLAETQKRQHDQAEAVFDDAVAFTEEEVLQNKTYEWLLLNGAGGIVWHSMKKKTTCKKGVADFVFVFRARYYAAEAKIGNRKATAAQEAFLESVRKAGGYGFVFRSLGELKSNLI